MKTIWMTSLILGAALAMPSLATGQSGPGPDCTQSGPCVTGGQGPGGPGGAGHGQRQGRGHGAQQGGQGSGNSNCNGTGTRQRIRAGGGRVVVYQEGKNNKPSNGETPDFNKNDISFLSKKLDVLIATMKELQMNMRIRNKP